MPNGKHSDHPLTDILVHGVAAYSAEADELIRKIAKLSSRRELDEWWEREIGWSGTADQALTKARSHYEGLLRRARASGWELPDSNQT